MEQTVVQIGNSLGVIIPSETRKEMDLKKGSKVIIEKIPDREAFVIKKVEKVRKKSAKAMKKELKEWYDVFIKENKEALDELSVR